VNGPYDDVTWPADLCRDIDYEAELGVVIGRRAVRVAEADAAGHVFGYTVVNDVSARDLQFLGPRQWDLGKSLDTFCPYGPCIVTADDIADPQALDLRLTVNGVEKQRSNTSNMIFGVAALIAYLTRGITLLPGDLIATGTPFGVGLGMKPPVYLKDGDVCEVEIEKIGAIRNRMRALA
jgi:2-keto-4-pentenoate hydratase/2-oxohepta-3-ene-1,7-dioic acid hydratase in catechol pathway